MHLAPIPKDKKLLLSPMLNGGWVVELYDRPIGAFSSTADMLLALERALLTPATDEG